VNDCNNHGDCRQGVCECNEGYGGDDCSIWDHAIESGEMKSGHLATFSWHYYHIAVPSGSHGLDIDVQQTSSFGDIDVFVKKGSYPDNMDFTYSDTSTNSDLGIQVNNPAAGTWYIGLYGYWASDYEITVNVQSGCAVDCGEFGQCVGGSCQCFVPYTGSDCSIYDEPITSGQQYSNRVETSEWKYFHLDVQEGASMHIVLTQDSNSYDLDVYVAADRRPVNRNFDYMNASVSAVTDMRLDNLAHSTYEIGVYGYRGGAFVLEVTAFMPSEENACTSQCSMHGQCQGLDACACQDGFSGNNCETRTELMELGHVYSGYVATGLWNYWRVQYFSQSPLVITVTQTSEGDADLYVKQNDDPTRIRYQYSDLTLNQSYNVTIEHPADNEWHIGVFGWTSCQYEIKAEIVEECLCTQNSHGHCQEGSAQCLCEIGYAGEQCDIATRAISNGQVYSSQQVQPHAWNYYHFTSDSSVVSVTMTETNTSGELFLLVSLSGYPTGDNFEYYDITDSSFHEVHMIWEASERVSRTYFIAVLVSSASVATEALGYSITAYGTPF